MCSEAAAPGGAWAAEPALGAGIGRGSALGAGSWPSVRCSPVRPEPDGGPVPCHGPAGGSEFAGHRASAAGRAVLGAQVGAAKGPLSRVPRLGMAELIVGVTGLRACLVRGTGWRKELRIATGAPFSWPSPLPPRPRHFVKSFPAFAGGVVPLP